MRERQWYQSSRPPRPGTRPQSLSAAAPPAKVARPSWGFIRAQDNRRPSLFIITAAQEPPDALLRWMPSSLRVGEERRRERESDSLRVREETWGATWGLSKRGGETVAYDRIPVHTARCAAVTSLVNAPVHRGQSVWWWPRTLGCGGGHLRARLAGPLRRRVQSRAPQGFSMPAAHGTVGGGRRRRKCRL